ncbi:hypothetical protein BD626DRAFT_3091 [Schizophyllum amplum]|uniref:Uncharacterized protein n=1 Tax=Schizophyllum amplum TaxID=97359 RepID=A0A550CVW2_9AGAR|nr:hypothetical protein BD626DRAFT_3091 [Auriculariopsis ampla]
MFLFRTRQTASNAPASGGLFSSLKRAVAGFIAPSANELVLESPPPSRPDSRATIDLTPYARPASRATIDLTPYARASESASKSDDSDNSDFASSASDTSSTPSSPASNMPDLIANSEDKVIAVTVAPVPVYAPGFGAPVSDADAAVIQAREDQNDTLADALAAALANDIETSANAHDIYAVPFFRTPSPLSLAVEQPVQALTAPSAVAVEQATAPEVGAAAAIDGAQAQAIDDVIPALSPAITCASLPDSPESPPASLLFAPTPDRDIARIFTLLPNINYTAANASSPHALANSVDPAARFHAAPNVIVSSSVCDAYDGLAKRWGPAPIYEGATWANAPAVFPNSMWEMRASERAQNSGSRVLQQPRAVGGLYSWGAQGNAWAATPEDGLFAGF